MTSAVPWPVLLALLGAGLSACQSVPPLTDPELAAGSAAGKILTVTGEGSGSGSVVSSPAGLSCTITSAPRRRAAATRFPRGRWST